MKSMKTLLIAVAATSFAGAVAAADSYQGFAPGNPDLRPEPFKASSVVGVQPGVGDRIDRYQGWSQGNPDLFKRFQAEVDSHEAPMIYPGQTGNPDL
jgi:hypothetical protein